MNMTMLKGLKTEELKIITLTTMEQTFMTKQLILIKAIRRSKKYSNRTR